MLTSFVAEPLLTGFGAGGYMLVGGPDDDTVLLDFFVVGARPRRRPRRPRPARARRRLLRGRQPDVQHRRRVGRRVRQPVGDLRGVAALRHRAARRPRRAGGGAGARRRPAERPAGLRLPHPRADRGRHGGVAGAVHAVRRPAGRRRPARRPAARRRARATRGGGRGAVLHGRRGRRRGRVGARAGRHADRRGPRALRDGGARAGARRLPRTPGAHEPAPERRWRAARLRARAARRAPTGGRRSARSSR